MKGKMAKKGIELVLPLFLLLSPKCAIFATKLQKMSHDISQSVSQRGNGAYDEENRRIQEVSDELQRLCRLYDEESRDGKSNGGRFSEVTRTRFLSHALPIII